MRVAMEESLKAFEENLQEQEQVIIQSSKDDYDEEQLLQLALKESLTHPEQQIMGGELPQKSPEDEIITRALEYGFDAEEAVKAISMFGTSNPEMILNYLLSAQFQ
mmetsp:Transcript_19560/g.18670  ORF Transcript_19560/g.18670 Transcript_19560/m.18670 type:complete len:106 (+) Transcript_19560:159-476(+)